MTMNLAGTLSFSMLIGVVVRNSFDDKRKCFDRLIRSDV